MSTITSKRKSVNRPLTRTEVPAKKREVQFETIYHGDKQRISMLVADTLAKPWGKEFEGSGVNALDHLAIWNLPVNAFSIPDNFCKEMKEVLMNLANKPLGEILSNGLIQRLSWSLVINFSKTHCPVYFQINGDGVNTNFGPTAYLRGSFESVYGVQTTKTNYPGVYIQNEVIELLNETDLKLFDTAGSESLFGYGPHQSFKHLVMNPKYSEEEIQKFVKRRNATLKKMDLRTQSRGGTEVKTYFNDRDINQFPAPKIVAEKRMSGLAHIGWLIRLV